MPRHTLTLLGLFSLTAITSCVPAPTPQENYDAALKNLERVEARLDNLRPAYDAARERAVVTDLSPLRKFEVRGPDAEALMNHAVTRDIARLGVGHVVYTALCHEHGGMLESLEPA